MPHSSVISERSSSSNSSRLMSWVSLVRTGNQSYNTEWGTAQPTDVSLVHLPRGSPKRQVTAPKGGTWSPPVPMQGVTNRQGKFWAHAKRQSSWCGSGRGGSRLSCCPRLGAVHPVAKQEAVPGRPSCSELRLCQRNASQGQGRCQGQFTHGEWEELRGDSVGCLESGAPYLIPAAAKPKALAEAAPQPQRSPPTPQPRETHAA